jgi:DNA-binding beta-propeller fold protein YncE
LIDRMSLLVTSASGTNGAGCGAILGFGHDGDLIGPFSEDPRIVDPRGLALEPSPGRLIYVNSGSDRVLALNERGDVVRDSGRVSGLDPGGANFGCDGRFYLTARRRQTILSMPRSLDRGAESVLPDRVVPFPRGFAFARDGRLYLASGIGPSEEGDNTIVAFDREGAVQAARLVADPELSPLDMTLAENGHLVVASEHPFGAPDALATIREYDPSTGGLVRVLVPDSSLSFGKPRGLRFGPDGRLYCVGKDHVIAFDFPTGDFLGPVVELPRLNGQALVLLACQQRSARMWARRSRGRAGSR